MSTPDPSAVAQAASIDYRPADPAVLANPYAIFSRMRDDDPCHWSPRLKSWVLTRYDDIKRVCQDARMSSNRLQPFFASMPSEEAQRIGNIMRYLTQWMVFKDAPEHTRLRRLTSRVFHVKSMHGMRPQVQEIADWLLAGLRDKTEFDFIAEFAGPLPCLVIMAMLGVPREDLAFLKRVSDDMALFIGSSRTSAEKYDTAEAATRDMADYFRRMIVARRAGLTGASHTGAAGSQGAAGLRSAGQAGGPDLLTELVALEDNGDRLTDDELVATCILLLFAGHETTTNHIANGLHALMQFPGEMDKLRANPSIAAAAVEELLRYDGPSGAQVRIVAQAHELHGKQLDVGDRVFMMLNAANRDPRAYDAPDTLNLNRDGVMHLTFGFGQHICLGFPLARLEGQIALPAVLQTFKHIEAAGAAPEWINSLVFRGMKALPVRVRGA
jgi:cytochrome P450